MVLGTPLRGLEMLILDLKCSGVTCKNVLPTKGGKHFFEKVMKKLISGEVDQKKHRMGGVICVEGA